MNHLSTMHYLKQIEAGQRPVDFREQLAPEPAARERLAIGLRHIDGVQLDEFAEQTGFQVQEILGTHGLQWQEQGLLLLDKNYCKLTPEGRMIYDMLAGKIM